MIARGLVFALLLGGLGVIGAAGPAQAVGPTSVSGTVIAGDTVSPGHPGIGLSGVSVSVESVTDGSVSGNTTTDASGHYVVTGLPPGIYTVAFGVPTNPDNFLNYAFEYLGNAATLNTAQQFTLAAGQTLDSVDITLPMGGTVEGVVFDGSNFHDLAGVCVLAISPSLTDGIGSGILGGACSDNNGFFQIRGLVPGSYTLEFQAVADDGKIYAPQYYLRAKTLATATYFDVLANVIRPGYDGYLDQAVSLSGNVKGAASPAINLSGVTVSLYDSDGNYVNGTTTDDQGNYGMSTLEPGVDYTLYFEPSGLPYAPQWLGGSLSEDNAEVFSVAAGHTQPGLNVVLAGGAVISGNVAAAGTPNTNLTGVLVTAVSQDEVVQIDSTTDQNGDYSVSVPPGTYTLEFSTQDFFDHHYADEWWNAQASFGTANFFPVAKGQTVSGRSAVLGEESSISGTVTDSSGQPLEGTVVVYAAGSTDDFDSMEDAVSTGDDGTYAVSGLPPGLYKVGFTSDSTGYNPTTGALVSWTPYVAQWYSSKYSFVAAGTVSIPQPASAITGIDAVLQDPTFADVSDPTYAFYPYIQWMASQGISTGTNQPSGKPLYLPASSVSRQAMASFLYKLSGATFSPPDVPTFADVDSSSPFYTAIEWMASHGISTGTSQPSGGPLFKPTDPVSRQAMALFLARYDGVDLGTTPATQSFADVPVTASASSAIAWMASTGISTGTARPSGLPDYLPANPVTRSAMAAFLYRLAHLTPAG